MGLLISLLAAFLSNGGVARFLATKAVLVFLFVIVLPIILWNFTADLTKAILDIAFALLPAAPALQTFTGLAGWLLSTAQIPQSIAIVVSALVGRFVISAALKEI